MRQEREGGIFKQVNCHYGQMNFSHSGDSESQHGAHRSWFSLRKTLFPCFLQEQGSWGIYTPASNSQQSLTEGCWGWGSGVTSLELVDVLFTRGGPQPKRYRCCGGNCSTVDRSGGDGQGNSSISALLVSL